MTAVSMTLGRHEAVASSKILPDGDVRPPPGRAEQFRDSGSLVVGVLDRNETTMAQQSASGCFDHARPVETVSASP